jgi:membrane protease YdiL (CAAX protease family)
MKISCPVFLFSDLLSIGLGWFLIVLGEEVLYRGIIQRRLSVVFGKYTGWLLASAIFAFIGHPQSSLIDNIILRLPFGLILGYLYFRSQSLLFPIVLHWVYNCLFAL